jgi:hypothetical protein
MIEKIQYKLVGPFIDLRLFSDGNPTGTLRLLGDMPDAPSVIQTLSLSFRHVKIEVCKYNLTEWVPVEVVSYRPTRVISDDQPLQSKTPRWMPSRDDAADLRSEWDSVRAQDCAATIRELS